MVSELSHQRVLKHNLSALALYNFQFAKSNCIQVYKFSHTHKGDSYTHTETESLLYGPVGSPSRLIGTVLQPGGGGWLGGVMDGEWPG